MADEAQPNDAVTTPESDNAAQPNGADTSPAIGLLSQYVKDMSFENPNAPACYQWTSQPQVDVQFNIGSDAVGDNLHETSLKIDISAVHPEGQGFVVDLTYAGLFGVRNVPEDQVKAFMLAEAPALLFPFARRVIADAVRDGGFMPLLLDPIDFRGLFLSQQAQMAEQGDNLSEAEPLGSA
ncbi:MAG: protein-export chaperone SecB [Sphingopyxis sp.]